MPQPLAGVPRARVPEVVRTMLLEPEVADVLCKEAPDGTYTVTPRPRRRPRRSR